MYRFDSGSKLLEGVQIVVSVASVDVVVAEFTDFRYNEVFPQSLYTVQLPVDVNWMTDPAAKPAQVSLTGPKEAAAYFFDALAHESWDSVLRVTWEARVPPVRQTGLRRTASDFDRRAVSIRLVPRISCAVPGAPPRWFDQDLQARRPQR